MNNKLVLQICIVTLFLTSTYADIWDQATSSGSNYRNHFGTNMGSSIVDPMMKGGDFKTTDGKESFKASMACDNEPKKYLEVGYSVTDRNNIEPFVILDKNLDGNTEKYTSPFIAQGVCSNGIVVCPQNSNFDGKSNCRFYAWEYKGNGVTLSSNHAQRDKMTNCICVNDSCSSPSTNNRGMLLEMLGGGAYGAISSKETSIIITQEPIKSDTISYLGQKMGSCDNTSSGSVPNLQPGQGNIDASDEMISQTSNSHSAYSSLLGGSSNYAKTSPEIKKEVNTTVSTSRSARSTLEHTDGTTSFKVQGQAGKSIGGNVNVRLDIDNLEYCQVQWEVEVSSVYTDDTERSSTSAGNIIEIETRECINSICPHKPSIGESIKHDCGKVDNFNEVTSGLMAVQEAAGDIICGSI